MYPGFLEWADRLTLTDSFPGIITVLLPSITVDPPLRVRKWVARLLKGN